MNTLTLPWTAPSPYRRREIIQGASDATTGARPMRANAHAILIEAPLATPIAGNHRRSDPSDGMACAHDAGSDYRAAQAGMCRDPRAERRRGVCLPDLGPLPRALQMISKASGSGIATELKANIR